MKDSIVTYLPFGDHIITSFYILTFNFLVYSLLVLHTPICSLIQPITTFFLLSRFRVLCPLSSTPSSSSISHRDTIMEVIVPKAVGML